MGIPMTINKFMRGVTIEEKTFRQEWTRLNYFTYCKEIKMNVKVAANVYDIKALLP
jgi:hypothetical protein